MAFAGTLPAVTAVDNPLKPKNLEIPRAQDYCSA